MATSDARLHQLQIAATLCAYGSAVRSSGKSSIGWGAFSVLIGLALFYSGNPYGSTANFALGALLIATGVYEYRSANPGAMRASAIMLGLLALWNLGNVALYYLNQQTGPRGGLIAGIIQAVAAYNTWRSHSAYLELTRHSDPVTLEETRRWVTELSDPASGAIEFRVKKQLEEEQFWRVRFIDDLALLIRMGGLFGRDLTKKLNVREIAWLRREQLRVVSLGEAWLGKDVKAHVHLGDTRLDNVLIKPEMLQRLEMKA